MDFVDLIQKLSLKKELKRIPVGIPNTVDMFIGKDTFIPKIGDKARDSFTSHLKQSTDYTNIHIDYKWNSLGFRGPEPDYNAKNKILFAGGSFQLGCGVPLENSYPHIIATELNASYINLGPADTITDLVPWLAKYEKFKPQYVILTDTRFIQLYGWLLKDLFNLNELNEKVKTVEPDPGQVDGYENHTKFRAIYQKIFLECDKTCLILLESHIKRLYPNVKIVYVFCHRKTLSTLYKYMHDIFTDITPIDLKSNEVTDLARDNMHPGIESHKYFAKKILNEIK